MSRLDEILNLAKHAPPFPKVAQRVMEMIEDPAVKAQDLAEVIQFDEAITANVLKICNAAYFGLSRKVSSLDEALVVIGHDILKDIIVTSSSARFFKGKIGEGYQLEEGELWKHSVAVSIMSKQLSKHVKEVDPGTAFTCGLLHDIGKRFLSTFVADDFRKILEKVAKEKASFVEAEKEYLGTTHAELGGMILEQWGFAPGIQDAVRFHHDPEALGREPLTALTALSNVLVVSMGIGVGAAGMATKMRGAGLKRFGINTLALDLCMANLLEQMEKAQELLRI